jgi:uncharacterized repeat protein (TIGR03803 family)
MNRMVSVLSLAVLIVAAAAAQAPTPTITQLFGFPCPTSGNCPDGSFLGGFFESADGNFYGIASEGGVGKNSQGTIFKLTPSGEFTLIYSFAELPDGTLPFGASPDALVEGLDGFLYGTTLVDGTGGAGTAFKISKMGTITLLHNFCTTLTCGDGANPTFLTLGLDENFYGGTGPGNTPTSVLFRMSPSASADGKGFKVLHTFDTKTQPDGTGIFGMQQAPDGKFYGTTVAGYHLKPWNSVFRFDPVTTEYKILHPFNSPNINLPNVAASDLILASDGNFYGLRVESILYRITPTGSYHELGRMTSTQFIDGDLMESSDGTLWVTFSDSRSGIYNSTLSGKVLRTLKLDPKVNGSDPFNLRQAADGKIYGMSSGASVNNGGSFWVIDAGLPAPSPTIINFQPTSGAPGSTFLLQGSHFVGTTAVEVNGVSAKFKVLTANYVRVTVPVGATSGKISVTNSGGTKFSTKAFAVQ